MNILTSVQTFPEIQPPVENDRKTLVKVSQSRFQLPNLRRLPDELWAETRAVASQETRFQLVFHLAPSQVMLTQLLAMEQELRQLPREEVIRLARQARGSWKSTETDAVAIVRQMRDEWDSDDAL